MPNNYLSGHIGGQFLDDSNVRVVGGYGPLEVPAQDWISAQQWASIASNLYNYADTMTDFVEGVGNGLHDLAEWNYNNFVEDPFAYITGGPSGGVGNIVGNALLTDLENDSSTGSIDTGSVPVINDVPADEGQSTDGYNHDGEDTSIADALEGSVSLSDFMRNNPGLPPLQYIQYMAQHSDEWAEKLIDYYLEKESLNEANAYTASREDTAYQRLVADLKKAGLNPAMMYGSSASPSSASSAGYLRLSEGANSRGISSYSKLKSVILGYMMLALQKQLGFANISMNALTSLFKLF